MDIVPVCKKRLEYFHCLFVWLERIRSLADPQHCLGKNSKQNERNDQQHNQTYMYCWYIELTAKRPCPLDGRENKM